MIKIKIIDAPAVHKKHGITVGREFEIAFERPGGGAAPLWFVMGDAGEPVGIWPREAIVLERERVAVCPECGEETTYYDQHAGWWCSTETCPTCFFTLYPKPEADDEDL